MTNSQQNCYDFDKTIYKKDSSISFFFFCLKKKPILFFNIFYIFILLILKTIKLISTKKFKEKYFSFLKKFENIDEIVNDFWKINLKHVNSWYDEIKLPNDVICSASPEFLIKPCFEKINPTAVVICTVMNSKTGKIDGENCKGNEKVSRIKKQFDILDTDDTNTLFTNCYTDSVSDFPIFDLSENKFFVCGKKIYEFGKQKPTLSTKFKAIIKQMRPKHYIKNALIAFPLVFSGQLFKLSQTLKVVWCIFAFCLMASIVYIINDLVDLKQDRLHPKKRKRPLASYMLKKYEAIFLAIILILTSFCICFFALDKNYLVFVFITSYVVFNIIYSLWLKKVPVIDVISLSLCYLFRLWVGGAVIDVGISNYLYLTVLFASLLMGLGKRRNELKKLGDDTRKVNKLYSYEFLDKTIYVCMACLCVFYSMWVVLVRSDNYDLLNGKILLATIPLVVAILMKYTLNLEKSDSSGDPIDVLLKDWWLLLMVILFVVMVGISIYIPIKSPF